MLDGYAYRYVMNVRPAKKGVKLTEEMKQALVNSSVKASNTKNSGAKGYLFVCEPDENNDDFVTVILSSKTSVIPTRALAAVANAMLTDYPDLTAKMKNNKNVFNASLGKTDVADYTNIPPDEIVAETVRIFFATHNTKTESGLAKDYQRVIRKLIISYKNREEIDKALEELQKEVVQ